MCQVQERGPLEFSVVCGCTIDQEEHLEAPHKRSPGGRFTAQMRHYATDDHLADIDFDEGSPPVVFYKRHRIGFY